MALIHIPHICIRALSGCVPAKIEKNRDYSFLTDKEKELLIKTTGIEERRIAEPGVTTSDLCYKSAKQIIDSLNENTDDIDILVFVSQSRDHILPSTAHNLHARLNLKPTCMVFDIGLGCSGYVYGLSVVAGLMSLGKLKKGLLLTGDISSVSLHPKDKSTYPLFGDAGTATLLEYDSTSKGFHFNLCSDGAGYDTIIIPDGGLRNPFNESSDKEEEIEKGIVRSRRNLALNGIKVFDFSMREVIPNIEQLLDYTKTTINDYDHVIFHQANKLINNTIGKIMAINSEKMPSTLKNFGNTSSASIPLTMVHALKNQLGAPKQLLLCGFGVGLSWGSVSMETNGINCLPLIEV